MSENRNFSLLEAPRGVPLKIVSVAGGHGVRQRLLALGFHTDDIVELNSGGIIRGPLLVRNLTMDTSVALGRGVAQKIIVARADER